MAYVPEDERDEEQPGMGMEEQEDVQLSGAPSGTVGTTPETTPKPGVGSGQFQDIRKYIKANVPATQKLAGAVGKGIEKRQTGIQQDVAKKQQQFATRLQEQKAGATSAQQTAQQIAQRAISGQGVVKPEEVTRFQAISKGQEKYSVSPLDLQRQQSEAARLRNQAIRAEREKSRANLLSEVLGKRKYTRGQRGLDVALLGSQPGAIESISQKARESATQTGQTVTEARRQALAQAGELARQQAMGREALTQQLEQGRTGITTGIQERVAAEKALGEAIQKGLVGSGVERQLGLSTEQLQELGLQEGERLYGAGLEGIQGQLLGARKETMISPEELSRLQAIGSLAGRDQEFISDIGLAGEYQRPLDQLRAQIEAGKQSYQKEISPIQQRISQIEEAERNAAALNLAEASGQDFESAFKALGGRFAASPEERKLYYNPLVEGYAPGGQIEGLRLGYDSPRTSADDEIIGVDGKRYSPVDYGLSAATLSSPEQRQWVIDQLRSRRQQELDRIRSDLAATESRFGGKVRRV